MFDTTLFSVSVPSSPTLYKSLILTICSVTLPEKQEYSEFNELSYYMLNNNDYECGSVNIEILCENSFRNPYHEFYISCVTIRADSKVLCQIDRSVTLPKFTLPNYTKVTKEGKMAFGISYYFRTLDERTLLLNCNNPIAASISRRFPDVSLSIMAIIHIVSKVSDTFSLIYAKFCRGNEFDENCVCDSYPT